MYKMGAFLTVFMGPINCLSTDVEVTYMITPQITHNIQHKC